MRQPIYSARLTFRRQALARAEAAQTPGEKAAVIRNSLPQGPYSRTIPRAVWWPWGGACFL